jgi:GDP-D-mannose dehydratase
VVRIYLAELLLSKGYRVVGMAHCASTDTYERIQHLLDEITVIHGDLVWLLPRPQLSLSIVTGK